MNHAQTLKRLTERLEEASGTNDVVAPRPDHPYLLSGADLLMGAQGCLYALFIAKRAEQKDARTLTERVALSRLALPAHTRFVLVVERAQTLPIGRLEHDFEEVCDTDVSAAALRQVEPMPEHRQRAVEHIRRNQFANAGMLAALSRDRFANFHPREHKPQSSIEQAEPDASAIYRHLGPVRLPTGATVDPSPPPEIRRLGATVDSSPPPEVRRRRRRIQDHGRYQSTTLGDRPKRADARRLISFAMRADYTLDQGVPYPTADTTPRFVVSSRPPVGRWDPGHLVRALTFAHWAVVPPTGGETLLRLSEEVAARWEHANG